MFNFNDSKIAFAEKSTLELKKAFWLFKSMQVPALTKIGINLLNFTVKYNFPFVKSIIKKTLFEQFVGGETREESEKVVHMLSKYHIGSIFDYSVEGGEGEDTFNITLQEMKDNVLFAFGKSSIPFVVFKPTGFGRLELYAKVSSKEPLTQEEENEFKRVEQRFETICEIADQKKVKLLVDAEESWIQPAIDGILDNLMRKYNKNFPLLWNTVQMYRTGRIDYLKENLLKAKEYQYFLGYKVVRGAYMEKERARAEMLGYESPIQPSKEATDQHYNEGIDFIFDNIDYFSAYFGTHNEYSTNKVLKRMSELLLPNNFPKIYFGQLYGMSDNVTYYLGNKNYNATKYLPYGSIADVVPYLTRRAKENTSVKGQTGRELLLITKELNRRKIEL